MKHRFLLIASAALLPLAVWSQNITFADKTVKEICVGNWDTNGDHELSQDEAAAVTSLGTLFRSTSISSFDELKYFTGLKQIDAAAFKSCRRLTKVTIPNAVTTLEAEAFKESGLTSIVLPDNVKNVGSECFWGCSSLANLDLGSVKRIENSAFVNMESLTRVTIPGTWTERDENCWAEFSSNPNLETVIFGEGIVDFPWYAFAWCPKLTNVLLPSTLQSISNGAFSGCTSLTTINLPGNLTSIDDEAFMETGLTGILLPAALESIGSKSFMNCASLTTVGLNTLKEAGDSAFANCTSLKMVEIPSTFNGEKGAGIFAGCAQLNYVLLTEGITAINPGMFQDCQMLTSINLPASLVSVGDYAFKRSGLTGIVLPSAVESLGTESFQGCGAITSIDLGNVKKAGRDVFSECNALAAVTIPATWHSLAYDGEDFGGTFANCHNLQKVIFREGVTTLDNQMFAGCEKLSSVTLPSSLIIISWGAFSGCTALKSITIPGKVETIDGQAFKESALTSLTLSPSVKYLGPESFKSCKELAEIDLGKLVGTGHSVFTGCDALTSVTIPGTFKVSSEDSWGEFANCPNIETVVFEDGAEVTPSMFEGCDKLKDVTLSQSLTLINKSAFSGCNRLDNIIIPETVTTIMEKAFQGTSLSFVTLPAGLKEIGEAAFANCVKLTYLQVLGAKPAIAANTFPSNLEVYVPSGAKSVFVNDANWNKFQILELAIIPEGTYCLKNVGTGEYLNRGADWGTRAVLSKWGQKVQFNKQEDGSYQIYFPGLGINQSLLFRGNDESVWVDYNGQTDKECVNWTVTRTAEGNYRIQSAIDHPYHGQVAEPGTYLGNNPALVGIVDGNVTDAEGMNIDWTLVSETDYDNYRNCEIKIAELERIIDSAKELGIDVSNAEAVLAKADATEDEIDAAIDELLADYKTTLLLNLDDIVYDPKNPTLVDLSALVKNPTFSGGMADFWTASEGLGLDLYSNNAEYYEKTFDINQTITDLPNGNYLVRMKGFQRPGMPDDVCADYMEGNDNVWAEFYANDKSVKLQNMMVAAQEEQLDWSGLDVTYNKQTLYVPNSMMDASVWFGHDYYWNEIRLTVTDGTLTFGVKSEKTAAFDWTIFSDFQLFYLGSCDMINVTDVLVAGYSSKEALDFTAVEGASAWIATGFRDGNIQLSRVYAVPANTGIYVKADKAGTVAVPRTTEKSYYVNMFQPVVKSTVIEPFELVDGVNYKTLSFALSKSTGKPAFFPNTEARSYADNKMYLRLPEWLVADNAREMTVGQAETTDAADAVETEAVTVGSAKVAGFSSNKNLDFTNVKGVSAWIATGFRGGNILLSRVTVAPAGTGLYIKADEPGTYNIPVTTEVPYYVNLFVGVPNGASIPKYVTVVGEKMQTLSFAISKSTGLPAFFPNTETKVYAKNKMYLYLPASLLEDADTARGFGFEFEGEENQDDQFNGEFGANTGIDEIAESESAKSKCYDLQGRQVENQTLSRGLYIVNGRKVLIRK